MGRKAVRAAQRAAEATGDVWPSGVDINTTNDTNLTHNGLYITDGSKITGDTSTHAQGTDLGGG